jgi:DNA polymerase I-like protein with 3'-5' exonuclease and polymerase domains
MMYAIDIETRDPNLKELGDGSIRKDGEVYCVGVYGEGTAGRIEDVFLPDDPQLKDILLTNDKKVFHNGVYDMTWLVNGLGLKVNGYIDDTMTREALINEYADSFSLDMCCQRRHVEGKNYNDTIERWAVDNGVKTRKKGELIDAVWAASPTIVAQYCLQDVRATYGLWEKQEDLIKQYDLQRVVDSEAGLYPVLMLMKKNGIKLDTVKRDELAFDWMNQVADYRQALEDMGLANMNSPKQITQFMNMQGVHSSVETATGAESWSSDALEDIDHPVADLLRRAKVVDKALGTFITGYFTDCAIGNRIHPTFYPSLRDEGGTITGRFSSRNPNMQNIPADDRTLGPQIRSLLIPEDDCILCAFDYKQIEYAVFIHYAIGPGAEQARQSIRDGTDYHSMAQRMLHWDTEEAIATLFGSSPHDARKMTKNFNFGSIYGLGRNGFRTKFKKSLLQGAQSAGMEFNRYCDKLYDEYFRLLSFVKPTCIGMQDLCKSKGYMRSIGGRIHHRPERRGDYAIVNYICQGGASDILKAGFNDAYKAGIFDYIKLHITVHDENVFSCYPNKASIEAAEEYARIMCDAVKLKVPIRVDTEAGVNWASADDKQWNEWRSKHG